MPLTQEQLRSLLDYNPATGEFIWLISPQGRIRAGIRAGHLDEDGYWKIKVDRRRYLASRLAVFWMTGEWPEREVDHRDLNHSDDRWDNLRRASPSQNSANKPGRGAWPKGVTWKRRNRKFAAQICVNRQQIHLGLFDTAEAAHARYCTAAAEHFGEFARD